LYSWHKRGAPWEYDPKESDDNKKNWKIASKGANIASLTNGPQLIEKIALGETIEYNPDVPTFSFWRDKPVFVPRELRRTAKDMSVVPSLLI
jgi:hypothetical protein